MSEFHVKPAALEAFAGVLDGGGDPVNLDRAFGRTALDYITSYSHVPHDEGDLFSEIYKANASVVSRLEEQMPKIAELYALSASSLRASARDYRDTDHERATAADALMPTVRTPPLDPGAEGAGNIVDPVPLLGATPSDDTLVPDMVHWIIDKAGWFSITGVALKIAQLFGLDPVKELNQAVLGDYSELAQAGNAAIALSAFERTAANSTAAGLSQMLSQWGGNGADGAEKYFTDLINALHAHADEMDELGDKYNELAQACAQVGEILGGALASAVDNLLCCAAALAAAGCLATVPGINVLISLIGAYQVWRTKDAVALFLLYTGRVTTVVESFLGIVLWIDQAFKDGNASTTFPAAPYASA